MRLDLSDKTIYENLEIASERGEFIVTELKHRVLGKTTALINFARDNDYVVLVQNTIMAKHLKREHHYEQIVSINSKTLDKTKKYVFDEGVTKEQLQGLLHYGFRIITGFLKSEHFYKPIEDKKNVYLQISLDELGSVPKVIYKGEEIKLKQEVVFHWETDTDIPGGTTIEIEHAERSNEYAKSKRIEQRIKNHVRF